MNATSRYHSRIYPANYPLLDKHGSDHPVARALNAHAQACEDCVGKEIEWPEIGNKSIDQSWFSVRRRCQQSFSAFAYEFLSYDLILDGWLEMAPEPTESEIGFLVDDQPLMRVLLDECEVAADADRNAEIVPLIARARAFIDAYDEAIACRFADCGIPWPARNGKAEFGNM